MDNSITRRRIYSFCLLAFVLAIGLRVNLIKHSPTSDSNIDLDIYRAGGALISHGINPWDFNQKKEIRKNLRLASKDELIKKTQAGWDYYASANLPFSLLLFGSIHLISDSPRAYRLTFALADSLLSSLLVLFVILHWPPLANHAEKSQRLDLISRRWDLAFVWSALGCFWIFLYLIYWLWGNYIVLHGLVALGGLLVFAGVAPGDRLPFPEARRLYCVPLAAALALGAFSPVLFDWGVLAPEDKGVQILLMVAACLCALSPKRWVRLFPGAVFLGLSVAFKGLGVFLVPWYFWMSYQAGGRKLSHLALVAGVSGFFALVWFVPFLPEVLDMMQGRLSGNLGGSAPYHASIWVLAYKAWPDYWRIMRVVLSGLILAVAGVGMWLRRISLATGSASLLIVFVVVMLTGGSIDRVNIGLTMAILLLGMDFRNGAYLLTIYYFMGSMTVWHFALGEMAYGLFAAGFVLLFMTILAYRLACPPPGQNHGCLEPEGGAA